MNERDRVTTGNLGQSQQQPVRYFDMTAAEKIVTRLHEALVGYLVNREYLWPDGYQPNEHETMQPRTVLITRVVLDSRKAEIQIFDNKNSVRIFPLGQFTFKFKPDNSIVECYSEKFSVLFRKLGA